MSQNTKALRVRIKSVTSTLQLTKAMGLVASSKIRRANEAMLKSRDYAETLTQMLSLCCTDRECQKSPFLQQRSSNRTRLVVIAGDRGLAGGYNANVFRLAARYPDAEIFPIGKRACDRYGKSLVSSEQISYHQLLQFASSLCDAFSAGEFDRLGIISTQYCSVMTQEARVHWILPFEPQVFSENPSVIFEPEASSVFHHAIKEYVAGLLHAHVRESFASEVAARRMAMDSAGKNATQMINDLQLSYNRARQGAITQEITEIVAGSGNDNR